jgi:Lysylphosphatidylglycerol synthase TM region
MITRFSENVELVGARVIGLDLRFLLPALALQLAMLGFRAFAWRGVLAAAYPGRRLSTGSLACAYAAGVATNAFVPVRGGEAVKVAIARTRIPGSSVPTIAASLSVILVVDALIGLCLAVGLWLTGVAPGLPPLPLDKLPIALAGAAAVAVAIAIGLRMRPGALAGIAARAAQGVAVFRSPGRYLATVLPFQLAAWASRIGVVFLALHAFGIEAGLGLAALLVVLTGLSTAVPVPGGAGTQQVFAAFALRSVASAAGALGFSVGMQVGVTVVNTTVGLVAMMILFRTVRPRSALRSVRTLTASR